MKNKKYIARTAAEILGSGFAFWRNKMFIYPENLKAKPMLWLWLLRDIGVIGIGALLSVLALTQGLGMGLLVVTALYAFLTIQVDGSSILDFLRRAARFSLSMPTILRMEAGPMNRKQKKELRQRQSTRQLMGIVRVTPHGIVTDSGERVFFLIQPDNLSVLSPEVIRGRVRSLTMLLSTQPSLEILALDSRESFQRNKEYYLRRLEEETEPAVRELLERDMAHLDAIQFSSASSRKFVLVLPLDEKAGADESALRQLEKAICDHGLRVRLAEEQDVKRLLAIYYRQDLTTEVFRDFDGEEYVHG